MNNKKGLIIALVSVIIMAIIGVVSYRNTLVEKRYRDYFKMGINHLTNSEYEEAITSFYKAIEIKEESAEVRIYLAKSYLGNDKPEEAIVALQEAQDLDATNEDLLKQIIEISNKVDTYTSYEFLQQFVSTVGEENISQDIRDMLSLANEVPIMPLVDNATGNYNGPITVELNDSLIVVGHNYYYTTNGTRPTVNSEKFVDEIEITKDTTLNIIGINVEGDESPLITLHYTIGYVNNGGNNQVFNQEVALRYLIKRAGINATKMYNGIGEVEYTYEVNNSSAGYSNYHFSTIGDVEIFNSKKGVTAYISVMHSGTNNAFDVGAYIIYEDGSIEETSY